MNGSVGESSSKEEIDSQLVATREFWEKAAELLHDKLLALKDRDIKISREGLDATEENDADWDDYNSGISQIGILYPHGDLYISFYEFGVQFYLQKQSNIHVPLQKEPTEIYTFTPANISIQTDEVIDGQSPEQISDILLYLAVRICNGDVYAIDTISDTHILAIEHAIYIADDDLSYVFYENIDEKRLAKENSLRVKTRKLASFTINYKPNPAVVSRAVELLRSINLNVKGRVFSGTSPRPLPKGTKAVPVLPPAIKDQTYHKPDIDDMLEEYYPTKTIWYVWYVLFYTPIAIVLYLVTERLLPDFLSFIGNIITYLGALIIDVSLLFKLNSMYKERRYTSRNDTAPWYLSFWYWRPNGNASKLSGLFYSFLSVVNAISLFFPVYALKGTTELITYFDVARSIPAAIWVVPLLGLSFLFSIKNKELLYGISIFAVCVYILLINAMTNTSDEFITPEPYTTITVLGLLGGIGVGLYIMITHIKRYFSSNKKSNK